MRIKLNSHRLINIYLKTNSSLRNESKSTLKMLPCELTWLRNCHTGLLYRKITLNNNQAIKFSMKYMTVHIHTSDNDILPSAVKK